MSTAARRRQRWVAAALVVPAAPSSFLPVAHRGDSGPWSEELTSLPGQPLFRARPPTQAGCRQPEQGSGRALTAFVGFLAMWSPTSPAF